MCRLKVIFSLLVVILLMTACGTSVNTESQTTGSTDSASNKQANSSELETATEVAGETGAKEEEEEFKSISAVVEFSGQADLTSIEVMQKDGTPLVLRTIDFTGVDFSTIDAGANAEIEFFTNESGQNVLLKWQELN
ncbi:hypothetical protein SAMN05192533_104250 [Mesobacillus persicus]|uniref:Uncharacterized protein n=1 Tax=Mesobacillus persicus TaxID=930146 RepID=A0A1H8A4Z6_9BACI|nr:hypothetical protein [Mesobacillus persicus]SEM65760.1 hypothetical protein SAMN05192533_104250 [Mesobacillus persicus]